MKKKVLNCSNSENSRKKKTTQLLFLLGEKDILQVSEYFFKVHPQTV